MLKASVKNVDVRGIVQAVDKLKRNNALGLSIAQTVQKDMRPYIPRRDDVLDIGKAKPWAVVYDTPYARKQYYDSSLNHETDDRQNPHATDHWDEEYIREHRDDLTAQVQALVDRAL